MHQNRCIKGSTYIMHGFIKFVRFPVDHIYILLGLDLLACTLACNKKQPGPASPESSETHFFSAQMSPSVSFISVVSVLRADFFCNIYFSSLSMHCLLWQSLLYQGLFKWVTSYLSLSRVKFQFNRHFAPLKPTTQCILTRINFYVSVTVCIYERRRNQHETTKEGCATVRVMTIKKSSETHTFHLLLLLATLPMWNWMSQQS